MNRFHLMAALVLGPAVLTACDLLLTDPAPASTNLTVSFQIAPAPLGSNAAAFTRIRRAQLRFVRQDSSSRDTVVPLLPVDGVARAGIALQADERIQALGIGAQLGFGTTDLFEGATVVPIVPGQPTTAQIALLPIPARVDADRPTFTFSGIGVTQQFNSAVLFASGDTIAGLQGVWSSEDATVVAIAPTGLALAAGVGATRLLVQLGALVDTVLVSVPTPAR